MPFRVDDALCVYVRVNLLISFCVKARDFHFVCKKREKNIFQYRVEISGWFMCCTVIHLICVHGECLYHGYFVEFRSCGRHRKLP